MNISCDDTIVLCSIPVLLLSQSCPSFVPVLSQVLCNLFQIRTDQVPNLNFRSTNGPYKGSLVLNRLKFF